MAAALKSGAATPSVFIDGVAGTTGLQIRERLAAAGDIRLISIDAAARKDAAARQALMRDADVVILCLPDDAAKEAVALAGALGSDAPRIIDASTAHRTADGWVYGFAELRKGQAEKIRAATQVANPGCYPTGALALITPLVDAGMMPADTAVSVNAVSGYSGGGRTMIESYEAGQAPAFELYGLSLAHKHIPELMAHAGLTTRPIFIPSVGNFRQGMLVSVPLHLDTLPGKPSAADIERVIAAHYTADGPVRFVANAGKAVSRLEPEYLNGTDDLELFVFPNGDGRQVVLVARLDNLGKGAAGAAVQNLRLMLDLA